MEENSTWRLKEETTPKRNLNDNALKDLNKQCEKDANENNIQFIDPSLDLIKSINLTQKITFGSGNKKIDFKNTIEKNLKKLKKPNFYFNGKEVTPTDSEMEKLAGQKVLVREQIFQETPEGETPDEAHFVAGANNLIKNLDEYIQGSVKVYPDILKKTFKDDIETDLEKQKNSLYDIEKELQKITSSLGLNNSITMSVKIDTSEEKEMLELKKKDICENIENLENIRNMSNKITDLESSKNKIQAITDSIKLKNNNNNDSLVDQNNSLNKIIKKIQTKKIISDIDSNNCKDSNRLFIPERIYLSKESKNEKIISNKYDQNLFSRDTDASLKHFENNSNQQNNSKNEIVNSISESIKIDDNVYNNSNKIINKLKKNLTSDSFSKEEKAFKPVIQDCLVSNDSNMIETYEFSKNTNMNKIIDYSANSKLNEKSKIKTSTNRFIANNSNNKFYQKNEKESNDQMTPCESLKIEEKKSYLLASELLYLKEKLENLELSKNKKQVESIEEPQKVVELTINDCISLLNDLSKSLLERGQNLYNYSKLISVTPEEKYESDLIFSKIPDALENNDPFIFKILRKGLQDFNINLYLLKNLSEEQKLLNLHILINGDFFKDCLCLTIEEKDDLYYNILCKDKKRREEFEQKIIKSITDINSLLIPLPRRSDYDFSNHDLLNKTSSILDTTQNSFSNNQSLISLPDQEVEEIEETFIHVSQVKIYGIEKGSIKVCFDVLDANNRLIREKETLDFILAHLSAAFDNYTVQLHVKPFFKACKLTLDQLDPKGNFDFRNHRVENHIRGGMKYFQPLGWKRYGLKVTKKYDNGDDDWLSMKGLKNEWAVGFHGFRNPAIVGPNGQLNLQNLPIHNILKDGFKPGKNQAYKNEKCTKANIICEEGTYFSNHIEVSEKNYMSNIPYQDKFYKVAFQSRLNPSFIRIPKKSSDIQDKRNNPDWDNDYLIVNNSVNIRPYGILLKTINKN